MAKELLIGRLDEINRLEQCVRETNAQLTDFRSER